MKLWVGKSKGKMITEHLLCDKYVHTGRSQEVHNEGMKSAERGLLE